MSAPCSACRRAHVEVIQNGIDQRDLEPVADDLDAAACAVRDAQDERLVLLVGRLVYEKGFHLALDALAPRDQAARRRPVRRRRHRDCRGRSSRCQARRLGLTRYGTFLGWVGDDMLHSLYRVADLCIVPSIYEPFGLVALEAMASGCLCVVADTGGLREVVPGDGTVGLRFPSRDSRRARGDPRPGADRRRSARAVHRRGPRARPALRLVRERAARPSRSTPRSPSER